MNTKIATDAKDMGLQSLWKKLFGASNASRSSRPFPRPELGTKAVEDLPPGPWAPASSYSPAHAWCIKREGTTDEVIRHILDFPFPPDSYLGAALMVLVRYVRDGAQASGVQRFVRLDASGNDRGELSVNLTVECNRFVP